MTVCLLAKNLLLSTQLSFGERVVTLFLVITIITFPSTIVSQSKPNSRAVDDTFQTLDLMLIETKLLIICRGSSMMTQTAIFFWLSAEEVGKTCNICQNTCKG